MKHDGLARIHLVSSLGYYAQCRRRSRHGFAFHDPNGDARLSRLGPALKRAGYSKATNVPSDEGARPVPAARGGKTRDDALPTEKQAQTKGNEVYELLREDVLWGNLPPNSILSEADLAVRYAASRSPIRYALARAMEARLVSVKARQGYVVNTVSLRDAQEILFMRLVLESAAAELACRRAEERDVAELTALASVDLLVDGRIDGRHLALANKAFHVRLAQASGNARLAEAISDLLDRTLIIVAQVQEKSRAEAVTRRHITIANAVRARDLAAARDGIRAEFETDSERVGALLSVLQSHA